MKQEITIGHTNKRKYVEGSKFVVEKTYTGFNHKIDYKKLEAFDFVPKLISDNETESTWEFIDGKMVDKWSNEDLIQIATIMRKIHKSEVKFPKNNFRTRINSYLKTIHEKGLRPKAVEDSYREMFKLMANMGQINACHNDLWHENILKDKNGKLWLVDWEYATMGDKHYDLAFFIESCRLNKEQEELFLETYNSFDDYEAYNPMLIPKYKRFAYYITICWAYAQPKLPFDIEWMEKYLLENK